MKISFASLEKCCLSRNRASLATYAAAVFVLCTAMAILGFRIAAQTNHDPSECDQSAYMGMSAQMRAAGYPGYSDGVRNPLFPWLAAKILDPSSPGFFEAGKKLNVLFAVFGTALLSLFFISRMGPLPAFSATALAGLVVLLPISTFFGAEVLFFILFLFICACGLGLLNQNPLWLYAVLGLLAGAAYLAKPSATPFLGLFIVFSLVRLVLNRAGWTLPWHLSATAWKSKNLFLGLALFGAIYLALISPRLVHAQKTWGNAFYSLPAFWFWADDWNTCVQKYTDCRRETLNKFRPEDQPTLVGYFRRHTVTDAFDRATHGAAVRWRQLLLPEDKFRFPYDKRGKPQRVVLPYRGFYIAILGLLATAMAILARHHLRKIGAVTLPILLGLSMVGLYIFAMGWYLPTGPGYRFIMTLYLPLLWLLVQGGEQLRAAANSRPATLGFLLTHAVIVTLIVSRLLFLLPSGHFEKITHAF